MRGFWTGVIVDDTQFFNAMRSVVERRLREAWAEGAADCGISMEEIKPEEQVALANAIQREIGFVQSFAADIDANSKANGGKLGPLLTRLKMWVNRYKDIQNRAKQLACADRKLQWLRGPTSDACRDCLRYDGRVYRASTWARHDIRPQNPLLACHGVNCLCDLRPTDEPANRGRPPRMTG